jgi:hypothetical protein
MPESVLGTAPQIEEPDFDAQAGFDLVVIAYPVWFLSPAPAIQGFFASSHAAVLRHADVVTVLVCRAMWQQAAERMKQLVAAAGGIHCDNVVVTHQGSALLTLISTQRALLLGKDDRLLGFFPQAGVAKSDRERADDLAAALSDRFRDGALHRSYLAGEPAVSVRRWLIVPELLAWYCFAAWAKVIQSLGQVSRALRTVGVYGFAIFLVCLILVALPTVLLATLLAYPLIRTRLRAYAQRLAAPTGERG